MKNRLITSITLLLLLLTVAARPALSEQSCYIAAPYVLHVDHGSAQVLWLTPAGTPAGKVFIETVAGQHKQQVAAQVTTPLFQDRDIEGGVRDYLRHLAHVENLLPYTRYRYEVHCGDGETTSTGSFITAPEPGTRVPFEFVATADIHDSGRHRPVSALVGEIAPAFVIQAGDLTGGRGHDWGNWIDYFSVTRSYLETSAVIPVVGSHDIRPNRNFRSLFAFNDPDGDPSDEDRKATYYTHRFGNLEVIVIDHTRDLDRQLTWAEEVLSQTDAEWIVVTLHEPFTNAGGRGSVLRNIFREYAELFEKHGVDLVITGHDHIYERKIPLGSVGNKPVHYITVNSAGNHREVRPSPIVAGGIGKQSFMFSHFRVDGNRLEMESIDHEGNVIDRLELFKDSKGMYQQEIMDQAIDLDMARTLAHIYTGQSMSEDLRYERRDLAVQFESMDPDDWYDATLLVHTGITGNSTHDVSRFPIGSHLIVYEQTDPSRWQMPHQVVKISGDYAEVKVKAPDGFSYGENGLSHALEMKINLRVDGREFDPVTVRPVVLATGPIDKVKLLQPADNETVVAQTEFVWEEELGAAHFQVQLGGEGLEPVILDTLVEGHSFTYPGKLKQGEAYSWRVRGLNNTDGSWSDMATFWIQEPANPDDLDPVTFSKNLIPASPVIVLPSVNEGSMGAGFRGRHSLYTWLEEDQPLNLSVTGGTISHFRDRGNVRFTLVSYRGSAIETVDTDDSVPPDGKTYEISLSSPYSGLHRVEWDDGNDRTYVRWPDGHPTSVYAGKEKPFSFQSGFELYFYVPEGTEYVGGIINNHSSVLILDSDGNEVPGWQNLDENDGYFLATVPDGQDGALWRIGSSSRATLSLLTVPAYLAMSEKELLLPVEVMDGSATAIPGDEEDLPSLFELRQNYPNPFNPATRITYAVPERSHIRLDVYNIIGQRVSTLRNEMTDPGEHAVYFDASDLSSGMYLYRLQSGSFVDSKLMMLLK